MRARIDLLGAEHLQAVRVVPAAGDVAQPLLVALLEHEVREDHHHTLALPAQGDLAHRLVEAAGAAGLDIQQPLPHGPCTAAAPQVGQRRDAVGVERVERDAVLVREADVAQGHRKLLGEHELAGVAPVHRGAGVDREDQRQVLLLQEHLQEELVQPGIDVPVHEPQVVAVHVVAVVGELHRDPPLLAAPLALELAGEDLAAHDVDPVELGHQLAVDKLIDTPGSGPGSHAKVGHRRHLTTAASARRHETLSDGIIADGPWAR